MVCLCVCVCVCVCVLQEGSQFVSQVKEMESFNSDLRQACRKVRRKVPAAADAHRTLVYDASVAEELVGVLRRQLLLANAFRALQLKAGQRASSLSGECVCEGVCVRVCVCVRSK